VALKNKVGELSARIKQLQANKNENLRLRAAYEAANKNNVALEANLAAAKACRL
jgi:hypothetical protein